MTDKEIREIFIKTCTALNDYQKGIAEVTKGIQRINARLKDFKPEKMSKEMDAVIEDYYRGMDNAGSMIDGLSERLRELNSFVRVIEDMEEKTEEFSKINKLLKSTENAINQIVSESAFWKTGVDKINNYDMKMKPLKGELEGLAFGWEETPKGVETRLDNQIKWLQEKVREKKELLENMK